MKVLASYLLAVLGGNTTPPADDVQAILASVGVKTEEELVALLLSEVRNKDIAEFIAAGKERFTSVPSGGAVGAAPIASSRGGAAPAAAEAKKGEKEESDDVDMGFSLWAMRDLLDELMTVHPFLGSL